MLSRGAVRCDAMAEVTLVKARAASRTELSPEATIILAGGEVGARLLLKRPKSMRKFEFSTC